MATEAGGREAVPAGRLSGSEEQVRELERKVEEGRGAQGEAEKQAERGAEFVVPGSELQRAIAMSLGAPAHAAEVRDAGAEAGESDPRCTQSRSPSSSPSPRECVICMEEFDSSNPEINTLCKCGVNRAHWHLMCLMQWLEKDTNCPICREPIFYEEKE